MKLATALPLAGGLAGGYVRGSAAGPARYEQLKQYAADLWQHPKVQTVFDPAGQAKASAYRVPGPMSGLVETAATWVDNSLTQPDRAAEPIGEVGL